MYLLISIYPESLTTITKMKAENLIPGSAFTMVGQTKDWTFKRIMEVPSENNGPTKLLVILSDCPDQEEEESFYDKIKSDYKPLK